MQGLDVNPALVTLGLVVNPIAGMGGRVGLKGTDGVVREALKRGAKPVSPSRAAEFLEALKRSFESTASFPEIITCGGMMGEEEARAVNIELSQVLQIPPGKISRNQQVRQDARVSSNDFVTEARDTKAAIKEFIARKVDLIIFVGGDGTARDILDALNESKREGAAKERKAKKSDIAHDTDSFYPPVLGVPSGVKMYSGVFALNPVDAAEIVSLYAEGKAEVDELEVMDIDEEAFRSDELSIRLYGYMRCPYVPMRSQASKEVSSDLADEKENQEAIAKTIVELMDPNGIYLLGPGTTVKTLADLLKVKKTVLGVDVYYKGKVVAADASEEMILSELGKYGGGKNAWIVVSPIGRQGMVFGRGNQQISPRVIKEVSKDHIIVSATKIKIRDLDGGTLKVDTGDKAVDDMFRGYVKVLTDYREWRMVQAR
jgi:predicted polyphosphate/ATP-dependent NAD kinase